MKLSELPRGRVRACVVAGPVILICHTRAGVFALDNVCTHAHPRLCEGPPSAGSTCSGSTRDARRRVTKCPCRDT